jgi:hypothetical protein
MGDPARLPDSNDPAWISVNQAARVLGVSDGHAKARTSMTRPDKQVGQRR